MAASPGRSSTTGLAPWSRLPANSATGRAGRLSALLESLAATTCRRPILPWRGRPHLGSFRAAGL